MASLPFANPPTSLSAKEPAVLDEAQRALEQYAQPDSTKGPLLRGAVLSGFVVIILTLAGSR